MIVDDDIRNIYSLYDVLEIHAMHTITTNNGKDALEMLKENANNIYSHGYDDALNGRI